MSQKPQYNPKIDHRKSIRLKEFDYTLLGAYFVTLCTYQRKSLFGDIVDGWMQLNEFGIIISAYWENLPINFRNIKLDAWVVMPNHFHGIILLNNSGKGRTSRKNKPGVSQTGDAYPYGSTPSRPIGTVSGSLGAALQNYKSITTRRINLVKGTSGMTVWQRNYYEHIIRNEESYVKILGYIQNNPLQWTVDELYTG